jgi:hypothetical protein
MKVTFELNDVHPVTIKHAAAILACLNREDELFPEDLLDAIMWLREEAREYFSCDDESEENDYMGSFYFDKHYGEDDYRTEFARQFSGL